MEHLFEIGKLHDPRIFYRGDSFYLSIPFEIEDKPMVDSSIPLGVDLGIKRLFVTSDGNYYKDKRFNGRKRILRYLKRKLNSVGTKSAKRHLKQLKRKERNINKEHINLATNALISSVNPNVGVIVLEDLKQIKQRTSKFKGTNVKRTIHNNMLGQVPFYEFKRVLEYKAQHVGLRVETVSPTFTSQTDSVTNNRDGNRCGCRYYSNKGIVFDADWNASINIAKRYDSKHPYSFPLPIDGGMKGNLKGRLLVNKPIVSCKSNYQNSL